MKRGAGETLGDGTAGERSLAGRSLCLGDGRGERGSAEESGKVGEWRGRQGPAWSPEWVLCFPEDLSGFTYDAHLLFPLLCTQQLGSACPRVGAG